MSERFFAENLTVGAQVRLTPDEARHLATVMRARAGDEVTLFDGSGAEFTAQVRQIDKRGVTLAVVARHEIARELACQLTLTVALPRGERQKWLVEKAAELGVTRLVPLATERGVAAAGEAAAARLRRQVIEASKQCGRNRFMEIAPPASAVPFFKSPLGDSIRLLADPAGQPLAQLAPALTAADHWIVAVGPEGGFTDTERAAAKAAGWQLVSLGPRILRVETAAIALAAWIALTQSPDQRSG
jgi:16S rRNA (uracil1498-N3)-methyltransferase